MGRILKSGIDTLELFRVEMDAEGNYYAVRNSKPSFVLVGSSIEEVAAKVASVFETYKKLNT